MGAVSRRRLRAFLLRHALGRLLYFELWFRVASVGLLSVLIVLGLFLPRIWTVSPPGFRPIVRVSGLDVMQSRSLARAAERATREGQFDRAHFTWLAAIANNAADPALIRGALNCYLLDPNNQARTETAVQQVYWLLRLTRTNHLSLQLAVEVFAVARQFDLTIPLLQPRLAQLDSTLRSAYLKALFEIGQSDEFGRLCREWEAALHDDSDFALYRAAYHLGWGDPRQATEARRILDDALNDSSQSVLATRLRLRVATRHMNLEGAAHCLGLLQSSQSDRLEEHLVYWNLMADLGRADEAAALARKHGRAPESVRELAEVTRFYWRCGATEAALSLLREWIASFGNSPQFWILYAGKLVEAQAWPEVERAAFQIRNRSSVSDLLAGFSYFLEGQAALAMQRTTAAESAFTRMLDWKFQVPEVGLAAASHLIEAGAATVARDLLRKLEPALKHRSDYWMLLFQAAHELKETELMLLASHRALQIAPSDPIIQNNYAAALLCRRERGDEAIALTFALFSEHPNSLAATVNHATALLMNGRLEEAELLLQRVPRDRMTGAERALVQLNQFEIEFRRQQYDRAARISEQIDRSLLYPEQQRWLADACAQIVRTP